MNIVGQAQQEEPLIVIVARENGTTVELNLRDKARAQEVHSWLADDGFVILKDATHIEELFNPDIHLENFKENKVALCIPHRVSADLISVYQRNPCRKTRRKVHDDQATILSIQIRRIRVGRRHRSS